MNMEMEFHAGMTKANPMAEGLGTKRAADFGSVFSRMASTMPATPATVRAVTLPAGMALKPSIISSATAFQAAAAGAGHSGVSSMALGSGTSTK